MWDASLQMSTKAACRSIGTIMKALQKGFDGRNLYLDYVTSHAPQGTIY